MIHNKKITSFFFSKVYIYFLFQNKHSIQIFFKKKKERKEENLYIIFNVKRK